MLKHLFTILFACFVAMAFAQTAYVAAPSGLKLRKTADAKGVVVKTILYGTKLTYVADAKPKVAHKTKEAEGFYLNGFWQKVVAGKDTGYVFDAFLLPFEPVGKTEIESFYSDTTRNDCKPYDVYFLESRFKAFGKPYDVEKYVGEDTLYYYSPNDNRKSPYCNKGFKQKFANGNIIIEYSSGEGGAGMDVTLKGYTFNQVYAMALSLTTFSDEHIKVTYENKIVSIGPEDEGAGCYSSIEIKGNTIIWNYGCGC